MATSPTTSAGRAELRGPPGGGIHEGKEAVMQALLRDPDFKRLSDVDVQALAADYRRKAKRLRAEADEGPSVGGWIRWLPGIRTRPGS
jgi:hypothetical protein